MKEVFEEMIEKQVMRVMEMVENGAEPKEKVRRKVKGVLGRSIAALNKSHRKRGEKEVEIDARNSKLLRLALIMEQTKNREEADQRVKAEFGKGGLKPWLIRFANMGIRMKPKLWKIKWGEELGIEEKKEKEERERDERKKEMREMRERIEMGEGVIRKLVDRVMEQEETIRVMKVVIENHIHTKEMGVVVPIGAGEIMKDKEREREEKVGGLDTGAQGVV